MTNIFHFPWKKNHSLLKHYTTENITASESKVAFKDIPNRQEWRINFAREIIDIERDKLEVPGFVTEELNSILTWICTSGPS